MKKQMVGASKRSVLIVLVFAVSLFSCLQSNAANPKVGEPFENEMSADSSKAGKMQVKYVGKNADGFQFDVKYNNTKGGLFSFIIRDDSGEILFEKDYSGKSFYKKVVLPQYDDMSKITFTIFSEKDNSSQTKEVVIKTKIVENVLVKIN